MVNSAQAPYRRDEADGPEETLAPERRRRESVGELLRQTRLGYGAELEAMARALRIRPAYLAALEQARYELLPGPVYAQGFVRAYAVYLGLDGDEAVRRFKNEFVGHERRHDLAFPMPLSKRSIPGGRMLLMALVLAVCGYGLWYYLSTGSRLRPEEVAAVPQALLPPPSATAQPASTAAAPTAAAATPTGGTGVALADTAMLATPVSPAAAAPAAKAGPGPAAKSGKPGSLVTAVALPPPAPVPAGAGTGAAAGTTAAAPPPASAPQAPAAQQIAAAPAAPKTVAAAPAAVTDAPGIVIRATGDSWVEVRDSHGAIVTQRLLHAGDVYRVPAEPGLVLTTGNASGLEILVDGRPVKPLGGTVRRNILLDPSRLLAGTAVAG